ncbi:NUDIX hydrolase [Nitrosovibrio sp. Nv17]|jgi:8-oxo-dGTP pyrophosphatase MutT (NUDIX family)|uniref:NUDIX hydrolase n=1 Tax=Nitrosovibrio sp. Nv17 TaxID=1855339 RepID=UPI0009089770|nr:NUDIX hydrolase [Nitrosovibrio sp. Nv17]SFW11990.1 ADP-ribose pyrophosphatase YjhB, NUDIX family [Nitrosovibrio sp. Nv17]
MIWKPNATVAAVVERDGKFLLVEEQTREGILLNQPAGHLEPDETILQGAVRETLEETGYAFVPQWLLGIYRWRSPADGVVYLRFAFSGRVTDHDPHRQLDTGIVRAAWFGMDEIREMSDRHRSPLVLRCIEDHLSGTHFPLDVIVHCD